MPYKKRRVRFPDPDELTKAGVRTSEILDDSDDEMPFVRITKTMVPWLQNAVHAYGAHLDTAVFGPTPYMKKSNDVTGSRGTLSLIVSPIYDLQIAETHEIVLPKIGSSGARDTTLFLLECGLICTHAANVITQPKVRFGYFSDPSWFVPEFQCTEMNYRTGIERFFPTHPQAIALSFEVTVPIDEGIYHSCKAVAYYLGIFTDNYL